MVTTKQCGIDPYPVGFQQLLLYGTVSFLSLVSVDTCNDLLTVEDT